MNQSEFPRYDEPLPGSEPALPAVAPAVVTWYRAYCVLMTLLFIAGVALGAALVFDPQLVASSKTHITNEEVTIRGIVLILFCVVMFAINLAALFLPRRPWAWVYHLINISLGLATCCVFITLPLLLFWIKPPTHQYFGYRTD